MSSPVGDACKEWERQWAAFCQLSTNGDTVNKKLQAKRGRVEKMLESGLPNYAIIEQAYLTAVARYPTDSEMQSLLAVMNETPAAERRIVVEDLFWSLLSSREFLFNH